MHHRLLLILGLVCSCSAETPSGTLDGDGGATDASAQDGGALDATSTNASDASNTTRDANTYPLGDSGNGSDDCDQLSAVIRDFRADHPDMEGTLGNDRGLVMSILGTDGKPVYAPMGATRTVSGKDSFDQWYRDVDGVNQRFTISLPLTEETPGVYVYDNSAFFPIDGMGWPDEERLGHNFHFTTEIAVQFRYNGGETFTFRGDDDVFVFVNGHLALDLGGVHSVQTQTIDFDAQATALGITPGHTYSFHVFHAERHTSQSNFRIETSIECFILG